MTYTSELKEHVWSRSSLLAIMNAQKSAQLYKPTFGEQAISSHLPMPCQCSGGSKRGKGGANAPPL